MIYVKRLYFTAIFTSVTIILILLGYFTPVCAATITVTNLNNSGAGSLRQAIIDANGNADLSNTINFNVTGTITLTSGQLFISKDLTMTGPAASLTISGNNADRVFFISSSGIVVNVSGLTIISGSSASGGAFYNNESILTVTNCTFSGNSGSPGGAIYNNGTLTATNCTFSGNSASGSGGAIYNNDVAILTATNCTFSGNSGSPGGAIYNSSSGTASLINTIVANSTSGGNCSGTVITDLGYNLESGTDCGFTLASDLQNADPMLGPLQNNGGPTQTHALLAGSPAIDSGTDSVGLTDDQRGFPRPIDILNIGNEVTNTTDIGAFELQQDELTGIPTMTEWGMIIFVVLAGLGAVYFIRRQKTAKS